MTANSGKLHGIYVAMNACYNSDGNIDSSATKKLARFYKNKGVQGLYIGGSMGEGLLQNVEERKQIIEAVVQEVGNELTVIAHVGAISTRDSMELARYAESAGVDALSAIPGVYYPLSENDIEKYWTDIADSTDLPFIIYNIPQNTGYNLSYGLLEKMKERKNIIGVKNSSLNCYQIQQFKKIGGSNFTIFNGADEQYLAGRVMGADAGIGGTYGIMPELFLKIEQSFEKGNMEESRKWQFAVNDIITELFGTKAFVAAVKSMIKMRGIDCGSPRLPLSSLSQDDSIIVTRAFKKLSDYLEECTL